MIKIIENSILNADTKYIAHQCNCVSENAAFLAKSIFDNYPYSDVYSYRANRDIPGTIKICGNGKDQRYIINMFGQIYPGKPNLGHDSKETRQKYFKKCLDEICRIKKLESIAFPHGIGCGAAGGDWEFYYNLLTRFAKHIEGFAEVYFYKL